MRTEAEILARIEEIRAAKADWAGFRQEVLLSALSWEAIQPYLRKDLTPEEIADVRDNRTDRDEAWLLAESAEYYGFAIGKILDHRGISAGRSVEKLTEYAWLLGRDDVVEAMEEAGYVQYGAPKVMTFGKLLGFQPPTNMSPDEMLALANMLQGKPCSEDCSGGCL